MRRQDNEAVLVSALAATGIFSSVMTVVGGALLLFGIVAPFAERVLVR